jgi:hypothetical protein
MARKFLALPLVERTLVLRALLTLVWARVTLSALPFALIGKQPRVSREPGADAAAIAWAIRAAARYIPGATCLVRALATQRLLARHGHASELRIGVAKAAQFQAHAWVECGGAVVVGGSDTAYVPIVHWSGAQ